LLPVAPTRDAVSLVLGSFEVGYVAEDGSAYRIALIDVRAVRFEATAPVRRFYSRKSPAAHAGSLVVSEASGRRAGYSVVPWTI
jgi:hypothetical protein